MNQFTFAQHGACYDLAAGDFRPVIGAAGTRHFEPDGVIYLRLGMPPRAEQSAAMCRQHAVIGPPLPLVFHVTQKMPQQ